MFQRTAILLLLLVATCQCALGEDRLLNMLHNIGANRAHLLVNTLNAKIMSNQEKVVELFDDQFNVAACDLKGGKKDLKGYLAKFNKDLVDSVEFTVKGANSEMKVDRGQYAFDYKFNSKSTNGKVLEADGTAVIDIDKRKFVMVRQPCPTVQKSEI